ncbi:MAG: hypothetical protein M3R37_04025 [Actinomycetota bacterium]|nr:hypothetical protein [Actinomycetota bacterium]
MDIIAPIGVLIAAAGQRHPPPDLDPLHCAGIHDVPRSGKPRLLLRTPSRSASYWMWGG